MTQPITRRRLLAASALAGAGGLSGLELLSLAGHFDHRNALAPALRDPARALAELAARSEPAAALHVGHSTHLLQLSGLRVLTDPWFYDPAHGGMRHRAAPACAPDALGALDVLLITHEHPDHEDPLALDRLDKRAAVFVADDAQRSRLRQLGFALVEVLRPWQSARVGALQVHAVPALHDVYEIGYVLQAPGASVYFAGDTALHPHVDAIKERFAPTAAILPVDGTRFRAGQQWVLDPEQAASVALQLGVRCVMPTHHELYYSDPVLNLLLAEQSEPVTRLRRAAKRAPNLQVLTPHPGQVIAFS